MQTRGEGVKNPKIVQISYLEVPKGNSLTFWVGGRNHATPIPSRRTTDWQERKLVLRTDVERDQFLVGERASQEFKRCILDIEKRMLCLELAFISSDVSSVIPKLSYVSTFRTG